MKFIFSHNPREGLETPRDRKLKKKTIFVTIPLKIVKQILYTPYVRLSNYDK